MHYLVWNVLIERKQSKEQFAIMWLSVMVTVCSLWLRGLGWGKAPAGVGWGKTCRAVGISSRFPGFRAAERMSDIPSRADRELCTSLRGKNSVQEMELFLYRTVSENCLVHLLGTHEKRISWAPVGYNGGLTVLWNRYYFLCLMANNKNIASFFSRRCFPIFQVSWRSWQITTMRDC